MFLKTLSIITLLTITSCSKRIVLSNTEFFDGTHFLNADQFGHSTHLKFGLKTYEIIFLDHYQNAFKMHITETGEFNLQGKKLTLKPKTKLICKIEGINIAFLCKNIGNYEESYIVNRDTLSSKEITDLEFTEQMYSVGNHQGQLKLNNPIQSYIQYSPPGNPKE